MVVGGWFGLVQFGWRLEVGRLDAAVGAVGQESADEVQNGVHQAKDSSRHIAVVLDVAQSEEQHNGGGQQQDGSHAVVDQLLKKGQQKGEYSFIKLSTRTYINRLGNNASGAQRGETGEE